MQRDLGAVALIACGLLFYFWIFNRLEKAEKNTERQKEVEIARGKRLGVLESADEWEIASPDDIRYYVNTVVAANERERALDYDSAIAIWEELGQVDEAARVRKLAAEQGSVKVAQKVVHGDEIIKTDIKDSVLNRSNVGGSSRMQELKDLTEMKEKGLIDDAEFKQMKKEILGK